MRFPLASNRIRRGLVSHSYGMVRKYPDGRKKPHQGWDFSAAVGTPCYAVAAGKVHSLRNAGDYGRQLLLELDEAVGGARFAFYAHLDDVVVGVGERVAEGQLVGHTGNSGNAYVLDDADDHLHFETRTEPWPGLGLPGRVSPLAWFGVCPTHVAVDVPG